MRVAFPLGLRLLSLFCFVAFCFILLPLVAALRLVFELSARMGESVIPFSRRVFAWAERTYKRLHL